MTYLATDSFCETIINNFRSDQLPRRRNIPR